MEAPFIDWNRNGMIDPSDIAISLAMQSEEDDKQQEEGPSRNTIYKELNERIRDEFFRGKGN